MKPKNKRLNLCAARARKEMSQAEAAKLLGITRKSYSKKELGYLDFTESEIFILTEYFSQTYEELIKRNN